ncbi:hypothetical protein Q3G72_030464 [Acer saccharum]|nr:hypothetical protein Q3G72_030464 [Acer saccharum]
MVSVVVDVWIRDPVRLTASQWLRDAVAVVLQSLEDLAMTFKFAPLKLILCCFLYQIAQNALKLLQTYRIGIRRRQI